MACKRALATDGSALQPAHDSSSPHPVHEPSNDTAAMARKRSKTNAEQPVHEASFSVNTTASNEQTAAAETTPENGALAADSSALQPAPDSWSSHPVDEPSNDTADVARKRSKTKHEQPVHEASVSVTTAASNEQTAAAETTPENGAQPADSSALQPAHDSSSPPGIMWAYFNLWDSADAQDDVVPFNVVPTTRRLHPDEEEQLVAYFFRFGLKKIPSGLPYVDGGKSVYFLSAEAMREMYKLAAAGKEIESIAFGRMLMVAAESWTMYVKRMTVTGTQELTELCERAYEKVANRNAERSADLAQQFATAAEATTAHARPTQSDTERTQATTGPAARNESAYRVTPYRHLK